MFQEGEIVYFTPFYFKNGNTAKNKFFIVIKIEGNRTILASLPSSINHAPSIVNALHGCVNHDDRCFNCYVFEPTRPICTNGFAFELATYVYGYEIEEYEIVTLNLVYGIEGVDFERKGILLPEEYHALLDCIKNSKSVKNRIKRRL